VSGPTTSAESWSRGAPAGLIRNDAVDCRAAARRHAGFSNEFGAATSAGPTLTAGSGQLTCEYSSNASLRLIRTECMTALEARLKRVEGATSSRKEIGR
jgi:hypothetical protein